MRHRVLRALASALVLLSAMVSCTGQTALCAPLETDQQQEQQQQEQQQEEQQNDVSTEDSPRALDADLFVEGMGWLVAAVSLAGGAALGAIIGKAAYNA